jgi:hypothetical protein
MESGEAFLLDLRDSLVTRSIILSTTRRVVVRKTVVRYLSRLDERLPRVQ